MSYNVLDFIDSKDVREFNKSTKFVPAEEVALICQSRIQTLDKKIAALEEIAHTYKNDEDYHLEEVGRGSLYNYKDEFDYSEMSMSETILNTIALWKRILNGEKLLDDNSIWKSSLSEIGNDTGISEYLFNSYKDAYNDALETVNYYINTDIAIGLWITQTYINEYGASGYDTITFNKNMEVISVSIADGVYRDPKFKLIGDISQMYVILISPFKKGDLVKIDYHGEVEYAVCPHDDISCKEECSVIRCNHMAYEYAERVIGLDVFSEKYGFDYMDDAVISQIERAEPSELKGENKVLLMIRDNVLGNYDICDMMWSGGNTLEGLVKYAEEYQSLFYPNDDKNKGGE